MKKQFTILIILFAMLLFPNYIFGLTTGTVYTDNIGYTHYNFSDGTTGTSYFDSDIGMTHFNLDDGTYGNAYSDGIGNIHYYFDKIGKNKYVNDICVFPSNYTCTEESQYQEMYKKAEEGLPKINYASENDGFVVPQNLLTPDGREQAILNGSYGSWLKMCRDHITSYKTAKANYDRCIQNEDEKRKNYIKTQLDLIKSSLNYKNYNELSCPDGYWIENNKCKTCSDIYGKYSYAKKKSNNEYTCACQDDYGWNIEWTECIPADMVCHEKHGQNSYYKGIEDGVSLCACMAGYKWNDKKNYCIILDDDYWNDIWDEVIQYMNNKEKQYKNQNNVIEEEKSLIIKVDKNLSKRMSGNILLQVEKNGEGWYVYPDNKKKYYLGRPADAFSIMRKLGLGATHEFITSNTIFPDHVLGKILLDVEQNGEAYYIYPKDKKAYYLGRPADAFDVMRNLGLGITNENVRKIDIGEVE